MNYFKNTETNIGEVKVRDKVRAVFILKDDAPEIIKMTSSCSCTHPTYDEDKNFISSILTVPVTYIFNGNSILGGTTSK